MLEETFKFVPQVKPQKSSNPSAAPQGIASVQLQSWGQHLELRQGLAGASFVRDLRPQQGSWGINCQFLFTEDEHGKVVF